MDLVISREDRTHHTWETLIKNWDNNEVWQLLSVGIGEELVVWDSLEEKLQQVDVQVEL